MSTITTNAKASELFPSFQNPDSLFSLFVYLENLTFKSVQFEYYIAIFGVSLTTFHMIILTRKSMMTSSVMAIMIGVAICDLVSMIVAISIKDIIFNFARDECTPPITYFVYRIFLILMSIRDYFIRCSTWLGVFMAAIRYSVLRFSMKSNTASNLSVGFYAFGIFSIFSTFLSILNYLRTNLVQIGVWKPDAKCTEALSTSSSPTYEQRTSELFLANGEVILKLFMLVNGSVSKIIPCVLLPLLTILLVIELHRKERRDSSVHGSVHHSTEKTTALVIFVTTTFFIATLPAGIVIMFQVVYTDLGFLGILLEFHVAIIWRVSVPLPWAILCSRGIASDYGVACFEALIALLTLNGVTSLSLFFYRMEAASQHAAHSLLHKIVNFLKFSFYFMILVVAMLSILIYPVLKEQTGYKTMKNHEFKLKGFMWCDSCIFMPLDSELFILWFALAYLTISLAFATGISAAVVTYDSLKISHNKLSPGIIAIQKNFFVSLIASVMEA
ncbi:hypothetical protein CAEBREN_28533 [Caenorhabditis brenneri]|uniref:G-protein coupled receptors family 1 profile domain-containing protein n=1 Tax=Caenorhabditis brenneri TaxID=135651 RepID=G0P0H8_CAEBE|nr:hypothetical protein CAEBREN_28533 [Caenorhabditis brenneri]